MFVQNGHTALFLSSLKGQVAVVQLLMQRHADVSICSEVWTISVAQCIMGCDHVQYLVCGLLWHVVCTASDSGRTGGSINMTAWHQAIPWMLHAL